MRLRIAEIEYFGEQLLLSERSVGDVRALSGAVADINEGAASNIIACMNVVQDAMKVNYKGLKWYQFFKRLKYKIIFSSKFMLKYVKAKTIIDYYKKVIEELEVIDLAEVKKKETHTLEISETYQDVLISNISNIPLSEIDNIPITTYREILELAFSWGNFLRGSDFGFISSIDKRIELIKEHQELFPEAWN